MNKAIELINKERDRQITDEGRTSEHDDLHTDGQLAMAAACYASPEDIYVERLTPVTDGSDIADIDFFDPWPWDAESNKRTKHDRVRQLVVAGALIVAELERLLRMEDEKENK